MYGDSGQGGQGPATVGVNLNGLGPELSNFMFSGSIEPGTAPGYQLCKTIYSYHPLGAILADAPVTLAQSQDRDIDVPVLGEKRLVAQFRATWDRIGGVNATGKVSGTVLLHNLVSLSRVYGIASIGVGEVGVDPATPLDIAKIGKADIFFNVLDPLNTAGSLVLNQDPNSPHFLRPREVIVNGVAWHPSRTLPKMNEQPLFIEWSASAYGFVGRSIYQRALYPLKTFLQTMITDQMVTQKAGLLVAKMETPGSIIDNVMQSMFGWKRSKIRDGNTGNVLQIGLGEEIETLNFTNLEGPYKLVRDNVLKNIASAAGMPAAIVNNETLAEGFGEGTEDAKTIARYLDWLREDMGPAYAFMDRICQRRAWTPEFYETLKRDYAEYRDKPYETAFHEWQEAFRASWPNLLTEPESERVKTAETQFKAVVAAIEVMAPLADPETKAALFTWAADNFNAREELFAGKIVFDEAKLIDYFEQNATNMAAMQGAGEEGERKPVPFSGDT